GGPPLRPAIQEQARGAQHEDRKGKLKHELVSRRPIDNRWSAETLAHRGIRKHREHQPGGAQRERNNRAARSTGVARHVPAREDLLGEPDDSREDGHARDERLDVVEPRVRHHAQQVSVDRQHAIHVEPNLVVAPLLCPAVDRIDPLVRGPIRERQQQQIPLPRGEPHGVVTARGEKEHQQEAEVEREERRHEVAHHECGVRDAAIRVPPLAGAALRAHRAPRREREPEVGEDMTRDVGCERHHVPRVEDRSGGEKEGCEPVHEAAFARSEIDQARGNEQAEQNRELQGGARIAEQAERPVQVRVAQIPHRVADLVKPRPVALLQPVANHVVVPIHPGIQREKAVPERNKEDQSVEAASIQCIEWLRGHGELRCQVPTIHRMRPITPAATMVRPKPMERASATASDTPKAVRPNTMLDSRMPQPPREIGIADAIRVPGTTRMACHQSTSSRASAVARQITIVTDSAWIASEAPKTGSKVDLEYITATSAAISRIRRLAVQRASRRATTPASAPAASTAAERVAKTPKANREPACGSAASESGNASAESVSSPTTRSATTVRVAAPIPALRPNASTR